MLKKDLGKASNEIKVDQIPEILSLSSLQNIDQDAYKMIGQVIEQIRIDPDNVLNIVAEHIREITGSKVSRVLILDEAAQNLVDISTNTMYECKGLIQ